jgi:hypothetical protein
MRSHQNRSRVSQRAMASAIEKSHDHEHDYSGLLRGVRASFAAEVTKSSGVLFQTDADGLNDLYLDSLPSYRQVHNCHACRHFLQRYGGLAAIYEDGSVRPAMWGADVPEFYLDTFAALWSRVSQARVIGPFYSKEKILGAPVTGEWSHIAVEQPVGMVFRERALTASQAMAAKKEDYLTVLRALADLKIGELNEAIRVLEAGVLTRSEHFIAPVRWLRALKDRPKGIAGENVLWLAIATAPEGFCHPRASVVGSLLEDIVAGLSFEDVRARFNAKVEPIKYQRPMAPPSAGNVKAAEALVEKLGIARSLERRFARMDDIQKFVWRPAVASPKEGMGIFAHLKTKNLDEIEPLKLPAQTLTWDKFSRTVLPNAQKMQIHIPYSGRFVALTAAVHKDAPPILKWDRDDERNDVAWYLHHPMGVASNWNLRAGDWAEVAAVVPFPTMWGAHPMPESADGTIVIIRGAVDVRQARGGNALFPECLRNELHDVRPTIEAYSTAASLSGRDEASACGYDIRKGGAADCTLRADGTVYHIDRLD